MNEQLFFHFYNENTGVDYRIPLNCTMDDWLEWEEEDIDSNDSAIFTIEEDTGCVHDTDTGESFDGIKTVGFTSYEAETEEQITNLLTKWKEQLIKLNWVDSKDEFIEVFNSEFNTDNE